MERPAAYDEYVPSDDDDDPLAMEDDAADEDFDFAEEVLLAVYWVLGFEAMGFWVWGDENYPSRDPLKPSAGVCVQIPYWLAF